MFFYPQPIIPHKNKTKQNEADRFSRHQHKQKYFQVSHYLDGEFIKFS